MKHIYFSLLFLPITTLAQLSTPNNQISSTSNPENGNVGVGTNTPLYKLDVEGSVTFGGNNGNLDITSQPNILNNLRNSGKINIGWNLSGGKGEIDFISNRGLGNVGGFHFYDLSNEGLLKQLFILNNNGNALLKGKLEVQEIKVTESPTADFVFEEDYNLPTLQQVENYIKEKKHLPEIPSAKEMEKEGVNIGEFQIKLLQKIEELTLYIIEQNKELSRQKEENKTLGKRITELENKK
ncbi:hypothetical protein [Empedobacter sp. UBA5039]|uniref:hypothetical protein n=1 Tax=Empedobacter sp. UBA5039 TaxID=1946439 RepID=UPI0025C2C010|nr:hypothetical protein [Empedobacter sp. UBA5039]